mgnify:CR=1 FL=1
MGNFIVFEGCHASGKSTLINETYNLLRNSSKSVTITKEPFKQEIREIIEELSANNQDIKGNLAILNLLSADRYLHLQYIKEELQKNDFVISDRYVFSSYVYQQMQGINLERIINCNDFCIYPDLTLYIQTPIEMRIERSKGRNKPNTRFRVEYQKEEELYDLIISEFSSDHNVVRIDNSKPLSYVIQNIAKEVSQRFGFLD